MSAFLEVDIFSLAVTMPWINATQSDYLSAWKSCYWGYQFLMDAHYKDVTSSSFTDENIEDLQFLIDLSVIHSERVLNVGRPANEVVH